MTGKINPPAFLEKFIEDYVRDGQSKSISFLEKSMLESLFTSVLREKDKFLTSWFRFDITLRDVIVISNSRKFDLDLQHLLISEIAELNGGLHDLSEFALVDGLPIHHRENSPTALEKVLDKLRWKYIEQITSFSFFDLHALFAWFLKLQIVARWKGGWTSEESEEKLSNLTSHVLEDFNYSEAFKNLK